MADTTIFVRNGLHTPIIAEESEHEESKKDEEMSSVWRILKVILFVICLIVFVHQTVTLFKLYYTYPTATITAVTRPTHFKVPALTFCSDNPYPISVIAQRIKKETLRRNSGTFYALVKTSKNFVEQIRNLWPGPFQRIKRTAFRESGSFILALKCFNDKSINSETKIVGVDAHLCGRSRVEDPPHVPLESPPPD
ncbi:hypothetical protein AVEN_26996-1 [Araneus ventricosus]|uniref:Uncharacterized protein n=1 Tax=Araneus ventricosus TaxID=182803 RepID=A0A4Y2R8W1_ARAVE|nr:hypothetical protein AVEN_26996-1 [Araneus ventricosus]